MPPPQRFGNWLVARLMRRLYHLPITDLGPYRAVRRNAAAVQAILNAGHLPSALEITDTFTLAAARKKLGAETFPPGDAHLIVEVDGRPAATAAEIEELHQLLTGLGATFIERAPDAGVDAAFAEARTAGARRPMRARHRLAARQRTHPRSFRSGAARRCLACIDELAVAHRDAV